MSRPPACRGRATELTRALRVQVPEFLRLVERQARDAREDDACHRFDVTRDVATPSKFVLYQVWDGLAALEKYERGEAYAQLAALVAAGGGRMDSLSRGGYPGSWGYTVPVQ